MKTRRVISILLSACMLIGTAGIAASAATVDAESTGAGNLAVSATSNLFTTSTQTVDSASDKVTVTYYVNAADYNMLNCQWTLTYDPEYLTLDTTNGVNYSYTDPTDIDEYLFMPFTNQTGNVVFNIDRSGEIIGNATKLACYPLQSNGQKVAFVTATFVPVKAGSTEVYLDLEVAQVKAGGSSDEITYIKGSEIKNNNINLNATSTVTGGSTEAVLDATNAKISSASISYDESIALNFKVKASIFENLTNPYVVFQKGDADPITVTESKKSGNYYSFTYSNIYPQLVGDDITAVLYGTYNGTLICSNPRVYSVKQYCFDRLAVATKQTEKALLVNLLNFASTAQTYLSYNTDALCNADLTAEQQAWGTTAKPAYTDVTNAHYETVQNATAAVKSAAGIIDNSASIKFGFTTTENINDVTLRVRLNSKVQDFTAADFTYNESNGRYYVVFSNIFPNEFSDTIYVNVVKDGNVISDTLTYSVESYVAVQDGKSSVAQALKDLYKDMIIYGNSVKAYGAA